MFRNVSWRSRAQVSITGYVSIQSLLFLYSLLLNFHCCSFFSPLPQRSYVAGAGALGYHRNISGLHLIDVVTLANSTEHALCPLQIEKYYYSKLFGVDIHHTSGLLYLSWPWQMEKINWHTNLYKQLSTSSSVHSNFSHTSFSASSSIILLLYAASSGNRYLGRSCLNHSSSLRMESNQQRKREDIDFNFYKSYSPHPNSYGIIKWKGQCLV